MSLTKEQLEQRLNCITGSDAAIICGVSPYSNAIDLWREKCRLVERPDISDLPAVKAGNYLEPVVRQWFSDLTCKHIETEKSMITHPTLSWMAGNIDGWIPKDKAVFEAKTAGYSNGWGEDGDNTIPDHYLLQVAHYVAVKGCERAFIAVLIGGRDFRHYVYERNAKLEEMLIKKEKAFWECVQTKTAPEPRNADEVISLYGYTSKEESAIATPEIEESIMELTQVRDAIKKHEIQEKELSDKIKCFMAQSDTLYNTSGKIKLATWKASKPVMKFDSKQFQAENKSLYEKYIKQNSSRRTFLVK